LSGSRSRSMSHRIRSFTQSTRLPRPSSASARGPQSTRRSTVSSSSPSNNLHQPSLPSPTTQSPPPSLPSPPTLEHEPTDSHETRAVKRRRTDDVDSASLHSYSTVPEPP